MNSVAATWVAVPLAGVTVLSTLAGGLVALRLRRELLTLIALTGGIVVAAEESGALIAVDATNGKLLWSFPTNTLWKPADYRYVLNDSRARVVVT